MLLFQSPFISNSPGETQELGEKAAQEISTLPPQKGALVVALKGDLGTGKTNFVQGFAKGLGVKDKVLSPTFVIVKKFPTESSRWKSLVHVDCYRIEKERDLLDLGWQDSVKDEETAIVAEWAEKIPSLLGSSAIWLQFETLNEGKRRITQLNG